MYLVLLVLIVIAAVLMCFIVLIQNSKGGGLASGFSASNQIMGVRKTTDVLEKTTWSLAAIMVVLSVASAYSLPSVGQSDSTLIEDIQKENKENPQTLPGFDASQVPATSADGAAQNAAAAAAEGADANATAPAETPAAE
jgi:preprotein translocase subunit SecG